MKNNTMERLIVACGFSLAVASMTGCATDPLHQLPYAPDFTYRPHGAVVTEPTKYAAFVAPVEDKAVSLPTYKGKVIVATLHQDWLTLWQPDNFTRILAQDLAASGLFKSVTVQKLEANDDADIVIKPIFVHGYSDPDPKRHGGAFAGWMSLEVFQGKHLLVKKLYKRTESPAVWNHGDFADGNKWYLRGYMNPFSANGSFLASRISTDQYMNDFTNGLMDEIRKDLASALGTSGAAKTAAPEADDNMVH